MDQRSAPPQPVVERGRVVLLVDDNPYHRIPIVRDLTEQGHTVLYAADGASGEALCRTSRFEIDALVACADMKRMCGPELARRVGRLRPEVRVLLMWRHFEAPEDAARAFGRGYAVIEEPFTPADLRRRLVSLFACPGPDAREDAPLRRWGGEGRDGPDDATPPIPTGPWEEGLQDG